MAGNEKIVDLLLKHGANINIVDIEGNSPLLYAIKKGTYSPRLMKRIPHIDQAIIELLIKNGANVSQADGKGMTPLHYAVDYGE